MRLRPLNDTVLIKLDADTFQGSKKATDVLKRGIIVAPEHNTMKKKANTGTILDFGPFCTGEFKKGDRVYFRPPSIPCGDIRILVEEQLLAVVRD